MVLIGCDFHPSWQQVSWLVRETGETEIRSWCMKREQWRSSTGSLRQGRGSASRPPGTVSGFWI